MQLYITRHGRTVWNEEHRVQGWLDSPLTQEGIQMAKDMSEKIKKLGIEVMFVSDRKRAKDTACYIRGAGNIPIFYEKNLREMSFGIWEGMRTGEIQEKFPEKFEYFEKNPKCFEVEGGEKYEQVVERSKQVIEKMQRMPYDKILLVSHGVTVKALQIVLEALPLDTIVTLPIIRGCSLIGYEISPNGIKKILEEEVYDFIPQ